MMALSAFSLVVYVKLLEISYFLRQSRSSFRFDCFHEIKMCALKSCLIKRFAYISSFKFPVILYEDYYLKNNQKSISFVGGITNGMDYLLQHLSRYGDKAGLCSAHCGHTRVRRHSRGPTRQGNYRPDSRVVPPAWRQGNSLS